MNTIFLYTDFRVYLSDWYVNRKKIGAPVSNRWIAQKMQINSTSWFTSLRTGKVGLSKVTANRLSQVLRHSKLEAEYFEVMVAFNLAESIDDRNRLYHEMMSLRQVKTARTIVSDEYEYFSTWYHPVVRAIIDQIDFADDYRLLGSLVRPSITHAQARRSVELLERLGLIEKKENGYYRVTAAALTTGAHQSAEAVSRYQQETLRLAQEALDRYPREERDVSTVTIGISGASVEKIRTILTDARKKIVQTAVGDCDEELVYQVNFQFFPVGRSTGMLRKKEK